MGIFGWSYPPGCSSVPGDEDYPCEVCGLMPDNCICIECKICDCIGDPKCYEFHGMKRTPEQVASLKAQEEKWAAQNAAENEFYNQQPPEEN